MTIPEKRALIFSLTDRMSYAQIRSYYAAFPDGVKESDLEAVIAKCREILGEKEKCPGCGRAFTQSED